MSNYCHLFQEEIREKIVEDDKKGVILRDIANRSGYHIESVRKIINRFSDRKNMQRTRGAGRPKVLTSGDKIS